MSTYPSLLWKVFMFVQKLFCRVKCFHKLFIHYLWMNDETNFSAKSCNLAKSINKQRTAFVIIIRCIASRSFVFFVKYSLWVASKNCPIAKMVTKCLWWKTDSLKWRITFYTLFTFHWNFVVSLVLYRYSQIVCWDHAYGWAWL